MYLMTSDITAATASGLTATQKKPEYIKIADKTCGPYLAVTLEHFRKIRFSLAMNLFSFWDSGGSIFSCTKHGLEIPRLVTYQRF